MIAKAPSLNVSSRDVSQSSSSSVFFAAQTEFSDIDLPFDEGVATFP